MGLPLPHNRAFVFVLLPDNEKCKKHLRVLLHLTLLLFPSTPAHPFCYTDTLLVLTSSIYWSCSLCLPHSLIRLASSLDVALFLFVSSYYTFFLTPAFS